MELSKGDYYIGSLAFPLTKDMNTRIARVNNLGGKGLLSAICFSFFGLWDAYQLLTTGLPSSLVGGVRLS